MPKGIHVRTFLGGKKRNIFRGYTQDRSALLFQTSLAQQAGGFDRELLRCSHCFQANPRRLISRSTCTLSGSQRAITL